MTCSQGCAQDRAEIAWVLNPIKPQQKRVIATGHGQRLLPERRVGQQSNHPIGVIRAGHGLQHLTGDGLQRF